MILRNLLKSDIKTLYRLLFFLCISVFLVTANNRENFVLVLDAGHGGYDPGAIGRQGQEKDITLAVALLAGKFISDQYPDVTVRYTRDKDVFVDLWQRAEMANRLKANLFISIHANASHNCLVKGSEVYAFGVSRTRENLDVAKRENSVIYLEDNYKEKYEGFDPKASESYIVFEFIQNKFVEQSLDFASLVRNELKSCVTWTDRGIKQAEYLVLRKTSMPRILIELDFITNLEAEQFLLSETGQKQYARAICNAFMKYKTIYDSKNKILRRSTEDLKKNNMEESADNAPIKDGEKIMVDTTVANKLYKIQILALSHPLTENDSQFKGYAVDCYQENNLYKYTYGSSFSFKEIVEIRTNILKDFKDAFIVCFENDKKFPCKIN